MCLYSSKWFICLIVLPYRCSEELCKISLWVAHSGYRHRSSVPPPFFKLIVMNSSFLGWVFHFSDLRDQGLQLTLKFSIFITVLEFTLMRCQAFCPCVERTTATNNVHQMYILQLVLEEGK